MHAFEVTRRAVGTHIEAVAGEKDAAQAYMRACKAVEYDGRGAITSYTYLGPMAECKKPPTVVHTAES